MPVNDDRVPIWSIRRDLRRAYFWTFTAQVLIGGILLVWAEVDFPLDIWSLRTSLLNIWSGLARIIIASAGIAIIATEVAMVIAEEFLSRRYRKGREEERARVFQLAEKVAEDGKVDLEKLKKAVKEERDPTGT